MPSKRSMVMAHADRCLFRFDGLDHHRLLSPDGPTPVKGQCMLHSPTVCEQGVEVIVERVAGEDSLTEARTLIRKALPDFRLPVDDGPPGYLPVESQTQIA